MAGAAGPPDRGGAVRAHARRGLQRSGAQAALAHAVLRAPDACAPLPSGRPRATRVSHRYRLPVHASEAQARAIARAVERRTEAFAACIADRSLSPRVDYMLQPNGVLMVVTVDGVGEAGFSDTLMCLRREAANIRALPTYVRYSGSLVIPRASLPR